MKKKLILSSLISCLILSIPIMSNAYEFNSQKMVNPKGIKYYIESSIDSYDFRSYMSLATE